ncbi:MAG: Ig-like domain-containing protein [Patescibacteria group bacterium]|nr:Ig-like domain-containing protein [Patescibacteria group bacterium]MDD5715340.1 Ig-like domain-containing protein [Patescibacteria group bacterium]
MIIQKGWSPIIIAIVISVLAVALVGVAFYDKATNNKEAAENTNTVANTNAAALVATSFIPAKDSTVSSLDTVTVGFSKPIDQTTLTDGSFYVLQGIEDKIPGTLALDASKKVVTFTLDTPRTAAQRCTVVVETSLEATDGTSLANKQVWNIDIGPAAAPDTNSNVNTSTNTNTAAIDTTSWETYTNDTLRYSIKYPSNWIVNLDYINDGSLYILSPDRQERMNAKQIVRIFDVMVKVYKSASELPNNSTERLSFEDWINQKTLGYCVEFQPTIIMVDNVQGFQGGCLGESETYIIFLQNQGYIYSIETGDTASPTPTEQGIINTFKFVQ